ncbi:MAG: putative membrane protein [Parcubacteria group bacterium LiPW_30]|nr:MAG: putative membrane protein [Parcubacteria group bacterium LiPW_30]
MWFWYAIFSAVFASLVAIFGKMGLRGIDTTLATTVRAVIMAGFLLITSLSLKKFNDFSFSSFTGRDWIFIILSAVAGALSWLFYFSALKEGKTTSVATIDKLSIVFVIIFAALFLGEELGVKSLAGAFLIVAGALLIVLR